MKEPGKMWMFLKPVTLFVILVTLVLAAGSSRVNAAIPTPYENRWQFEGSLNDSVSSAGNLDGYFSADPGSPSPGGFYSSNAVEGSTSLEFKDGSSAQIGYTGANRLLINGQSSAGYSISMLVYFDQTYFDQAQRLMSLFDVNTGGSTDLNYDGSGHLFLSAAGSSLEATSAITYGKWYNVVIIRDNQSLYLYVNNVSANQGGLSLYQPNTIILSAPDLGMSFYGNMDDVISYSFPLVEADVKDLYDYYLGATPTDIALSAAGVVENTSNVDVGTLSSTDADAGESFTYTLVSGTGGDDNSLFTISGSTLKLSSAADYETKSSLKVLIRTTDLTGRYYEESLTIAVTNVNEAPTNIALSNVSVSEGTTAVGSLSSTDPDASDTFTYTLVTGTGDTDNSSFQISGNNLALKAAAPDYDTAAPTYSVRVQTEDAGGLTYSKTFTITVTNVNEVPTDISLSSSSISENAASGDSIGSLSAIDPDAADTFSYTLVSGIGDTDNSCFTISGNSLKLAIQPDYETKDSYSIRVRVTDAGVLSYEEVFTITIIDGNDAPTDLTLSGGSVVENTSDVTAGTLGSTDANGADNFTYTLVAGTGSDDNALFSITGNTLKLDTAVNYETKTSLKVRIRTTDNGGLYYEKALTVSVTNVNEAPTDLALSAASIAENSASGTTIGALSASDPDSGDTFTYTLPAAVGDNNLFSITGSSLKLAFIPDYETKNSYSVTVRVSDAGGLTYDEAFSITITNANDAPIDINLSAASVAEHSVTPVSVGTLSATDPDGAGAFTYTLVGGDTSNFEIVSTNQVRMTTSPDYEVKDSYSLTIRVSDSSGATFDKSFTITVEDGNDPPTDITLSPSTVAENATSGITVGTLSSVDITPADTFTYTLVSGSGSTDNALFSIDTDSLTFNSVANYESKSSYSIRVRSTDALGLSFEKIITITVSNINEAPTDIDLSPASISENAAVGTAIGTFTATDPDASSTFTYSLVTGLGDDDNSSFNIQSGILKLGILLDYETKTSYSIRVQVSDGALTYEEMFTVTVSDGNDAPTDITLSTNSANENLTAGSTIATISTTDPNAGNTFIYTLVTGSGSGDNSSFTITGNGLQLNASPDYETKNSYQLRIRSTDNGGLFFEKAFDITIANVNEAPNNITLNHSSVAENSATGTDIGTLGATDPDSGASLTYSLVSGTGSTDNAKFSISGDLLKTAAVLNYESGSSYSIRIRVTDQGSLFYEEVFVIQATDVNEAPTDITLSNDSIAENTASGTTVGTLGNVDSDTTNTYTYSLVSGSGSADNNYFTIAGASLKLAAIPDYETKAGYNIRIRVNDGLNNFEKAFTLTVFDGADTPTDISLSHSSVAEQTPIGTTLASISAVDQDAAETFTYTLVTGTGDTDNNSFTISTNELKLAVLTDRETKSSYSVRIRVTDSDALYYEKAFVITIANVNEAPIDITVSKSSIAENSSIGTVIGTLTTIDPDTGDTFTYSLVSGTGDTDNASFTITGNSLKLAIVPDYEIKTNYSLRIRATDAGSLSYEKAFTMTVTDVDETVHSDPPAATPTPTVAPTPTVTPEPTKAPVIETITTDVKNNKNDDTVTKLEITRTTQADGTVTDNMTLQTDDTQEAINRLNETGSDTARVIMPETENTSAKTEITIDQKSTELLSAAEINLELQTQNAIINIPSAALKTATDKMDEDLYFNVAPVSTKAEQTDTLDRVKSNTMVMELMQGDGVTTVGTPMEIETNMPSSAVDIVLPLTGIVIPSDPKERTAFLDKLAVYIEHSDGEKEVLRGELVEYSAGVYGLKFTVTKFSTFTVIIDEDYLKKADECRLLSLNGVKVIGSKKTIYCENAVSSLKFTAVISDGASFVMYTDKECTKVLKSNKTKLTTGKNVVYLKVTSYDGKHSKIYKITVVRKNK